jgi:hypothetical protein
MEHLGYQMVRNRECNRHASAIDAPTVDEEGRIEAACEAWPRLRSARHCKRR